MRACSHILIHQSNTYKLSVLITTIPICQMGQTAPKVDIKLKNNTKRLTDRKGGGLG